METLLLHCRAGFEGEACAEISDLAARCQVAGYARAKPAVAYAEFVCMEAADAENLMQQLCFRQLIFIRQWARGCWLSLPEKGRTQPLLALLESYPAVGEVWLEVLDTNEGKAVSTFCRKFSRPLQQALQKSACWQPETASKRLLLTFRSGREVFVGIAENANSAVWPMGIPRLKFPHQAPSRSTLKLEEAWHHFVPRNQWALRLAPGMCAVDLGAAPGGWTWQLVHKHMQVVAVDNGPMDAALMDSGLVEHLQADGFTYRPRHQVDWMVCDIVEKPARNAALLATWIGEGWCREAVVNLKLPMKQRYTEVQRLLERLRQHFSQINVDAGIACRQLYHDREEVTCHVWRQHS